MRVFGKETGLTAMIVQDKRAGAEAEARERDRCRDCGS